MAGQAINLTRLEFDLLVYMAKNVGRVITPEELLKEIWGASLENGGTQNQVNCTFKRLRKKIPLSLANCFVKLRRYGYRLDYYDSE